MSTRAAVLLAAPFAVLAFVLDLSCSVWLQPLTWRAGRVGVAQAAFLVQPVVSLILPVAVYAMIAGAFRRRPATWHSDPDGRRFVVSLSPRRAWTAIMVGWAAARAVPVDRFPHQDQIGIDRSGLLSTVSIIVAVLCLTVVVLVPVADRPRICLNPEGLTVRRVGRPMKIRWVELVPGGPPRPGGRNPATLDLRRFDPLPGVMPPRWVSLPANGLHIDTAFLAYTIRWYVEHPDRRAQIGDAGELEELQRGFAAEDAASP